eukprot:4169459-Alexandrium_andersonii.AAC.1
MSIAAGESGEQVEFECHRCVVAACSPAFDRMLDRGMQAGAERRVSLKNVCPGAVKALLEYMYTDQ